MTETLVSLWTAVRQRLEAAGVDSPVLDARLLLEAGAGVKRLDIVTDPRRPVTADQVAAVDALARRREAREPIGHIVGRKAFWTMDLAVSPDVLIPRPETELLVETALELIPPDAPARVLDLGVGSGAILIAVLGERLNATGVGVDASVAALAMAALNVSASGHGERIELREGDWGQGLPQAFDLVLSNPPYIATEEIDGLTPEVARHEPRLALDGGPDGLGAYRQIIGGLGAILKPGGAFAFEVGAGQAEAVMELLRAGGFSPESPKRDLAGVPRVVWGRRPTDTTG
ncbi:MAG: peptide chain release factor N(5)-glutamine methyltransferase [Hyphomonadaceae bacterium]